jgi:integrase
MRPPAPRSPVGLAPLGLAKAAAGAIELARAAKAENTQRAYDADWRRFDAWCAGRGLNPMPADPVTVGLFIADVTAGVAGLAPATIDRMVSGIAAAHRAGGFMLDRRHPAIADVLQGLRRTKRATRKRAAPIMPDALAKLLEACEGDLRGLRDRAIILLGWTGALRRSEITGVDREHLTEHPEGLLLHLPSSKGDQEGEGVTLGIPFAKRPTLCPVRALNAWLEAADIDGGPVFRRINKWGAVELDRLTDQSVRLILKRRAKAARLPAAELARISGHSLRAGFITTAYEKDVPEQATQRHARHKKADTTRSYNRVVSAFKQNAAKALLDADR